MRFLLGIRGWLIVAAFMVAVIIALQPNALAQSANAAGLNQVSSKVAPMQTSDGMLGNIVSDFTIAASGWAHQLQSLALNLFMWLVGISTCWTVVSMAMKNEDFSSIVFELCRFFIFSGFFLWLLNSSNLGLDLANSISEAANRATGRNVRGPDDVLKIGLDVFKLATSHFSIWHLANSLAFFFIGLIFLICSAVMAVNFMMLQIMIHLLAICGVFFLGFGGARWTSDVALSYYRSCLSAGAQLMGMIFIVSAGYNVLDAQFQYASTHFDLMFAARMLVIGIVFFMLSLKLPNALAQLVSALGSSAADVNRAGRAFHMSKVVGAAAGVALGAVGGAVVGAKAAAAGAKGATASKGGGEAGKSVADGIGKLAEGVKGPGESEGKKSIHARTGKDGGGSRLQGQTKPGAAAGRASGTRTAGSGHASDMRNAIRSGIRGFEQRIPAGLKGGLKGAGKGALSAARTAMDGNLGGAGAFHKTATAGLRAVASKSGAAVDNQQAGGRPPEALGDAAASAIRGDADPATRSHTDSLAGAIEHDAGVMPGESARQSEDGNSGEAVEASPARSSMDQVSLRQDGRESLHDQHVQDWMTGDGQPLLEGPAHGRHIASDSAVPKGDVRPAQHETSNVPYQRLVNQPSPEPSARGVSRAPAANYMDSPPPAGRNGASTRAPLQASGGAPSHASRGAGQPVPVKSDVPYVRLPEAPPVQSGRRGSGTSQQALVHAGGGTPSPPGARASTSGGTWSAAPTVSAGGSPSHVPLSETPPSQSGARSGDIGQPVLAGGVGGTSAATGAHAGAGGGAQGASTVSASTSPPHAPLSQTPPVQSGVRSGDISQRTLAHAKSNASDGADSGVGSPSSPISPTSPMSPADPADEARDAQGSIQDDAGWEATESAPDASLDEVSARGFWVERRPTSRDGEASDKQDEAPS